MRLSLIAVIITILAASSVSAQQRLVDEVKKDISSMTITADGYKKAKAKLLPALSHDATARKAGTWWVAASIDLGIYDKLIITRQLGTKVEPIELGNALIDGYDMMAKALSLDTTFLRDNAGNIRLDKRGNPRFKTKFSKRIMRALYSRLLDYSSVGGELFLAGDMNRASKAWGIYCDLALSPQAKLHKVNEPDSIIGYYRYYQGLADYQAGHFADALIHFRQAEKLGFVKKRMYDTWIDAAIKQHDTILTVAVAEVAHERYGDRDSKYLRILINDRLTRERYSEASTLLQEALKRDPNNAEYHDLMGQIVELLYSPADALKHYRHAVQLAPDYATAQFDLGNALYRIALNEPQPRSDSAMALYLEAADHVERAYNLGLRDDNTKMVLARLYYLLGSDKIDNL